jgi:uncharacterized protein YjbI with pentapeptide repeats
LAAATPLERTAIVLRLIKERPGGADLQGALLEEVDLAGAELAGARLRGAILGNASLRGAMLEDADLRDAVLRFADLCEAVLEGARLQGADLWGARLERATLAGADLRGAGVAEGILRGADLTGADLRGAYLGRADLRGAVLRGANLEGAELAGANLQGAVLSEGKLRDVDLSSCDLAHIRLGGAWLDRTRLRQQQLGGAVEEEPAGEYDAASSGYLALERNFAALGDPDAARWAFGKKRRMQKLAARANARSAWVAGRWGEAAQWSAAYAGDQFFEWLSNYGESVPRVLVSMVLLYALFALLYGLTGSVVRVVDTPNGPDKVVTRNPVDLAMFSLSVMATAGPPPDTVLATGEFAYLLVGIQGLLAIFLIGVLAFVAANRIRRS